MSDDRPSREDRTGRQLFNWEVAKGFILAAAAVLTAVTGYSQYKTSRMLDEVSAKLEERKHQDDIGFRVYDALERVLLKEKRSADDPQEQALAHLIELTEEPLRTGLYQALRGHTRDPEVIAEIDQWGVFDRDQTLLADEPLGGRPRSVRSSTSRLLSVPITSAFAQGELRSYQIDVLYCAARESGITEARASRAAEYRKALSGTGANITIRLLPLLVQGRRGYHSSLDEVRALPEDVQAAQDISVRLKFAVKPALLQIEDQRPHRIVVFVCAK